MNVTHPRNQLDSLLGNPLRFSLLAALAGVEDMTFTQLRDFLMTTDSTLSKHASTLDERGYITIKKVFVGKKPRTILRISPTGRKQWNSHLAALQAIANTADPKETNNPN